VRALVLQHGPLAPAGLLGEWLDDHGIETVTFRADESPDWPALEAVDFIACLGSRFDPGRDPDEPSVAGTLALLRDAVERDVPVPVLGLCFGGQALAVALGGTVGPTPEPELGWIEVETDDPEAIPAGPWLAWHRHRFTVPPGATEIARNASAPQAFRHGRHLGTQFHPESTIEIVSGWASRDGHDTSHLEAGREHAATAARHARQLFDGFLAQAVGERSASDVAV
jgi:GMP synthase-like glutamine amidotransferase